MSPGRLQHHPIRVDHHYHRPSFVSHHSPRPTDTGLSYCPWHLFESLHREWLRPSRGYSSMYSGSWTLRRRQRRFLSCHWCHQHPHHRAIHRWLSPNCAGVELHNSVASGLLRSQRSERRGGYLRVSCGAGTVGCGRCCDLSHVRSHKWQLHCPLLEYRAVFVESYLEFSFRILMLLSSVVLMMKRMGGLDNCS